MALMFNGMPIEFDVMLQRLQAAMRQPDGGRMLWRGNPTQREHGYGAVPKRSNRTHN